MIKAKFDDKKDSVKTIVVAVTTQFNSFEEKCDILVTENVEVLAFNLNINNTCVLTILIFFKLNY